MNDHSCCSTPLPAFGVICSSFMLEKTLESPMDCKEISPGCSLEGIMLKLKLQYFGHLMWRVDSLEKTDAGRDWGQEEKGTTEDEIAGWHHRRDGHEFEKAPGVGDGQGSLVCSPWGHRVRHYWATELNSPLVSSPNKYRELGDPTSPFWRRSALGFLWKEWC